MDNTINKSNNMTMTMSAAHCDTIKLVYYTLYVLQFYGLTKTFAEVA